MPSMANITVKNVANADVVYNAAVPSAGDKSSARWNQNAASSIPGQRPVLQVLTRDNGRGNGRHLSVTYKYPVIQTIGSIPTVVATIPLSVEGTLPTNVDQAAITEAFTQFGNLLVSTLLRSVATEGYAPT